jgi:trans-aconitate methyltransferase
VSTVAGGMQPQSFAALARLEENSFWFASRNRLLTWALGRYFPAARDVHEIGCGNGIVLASWRAAYPQLRLSGSELFEEGLEHARVRLPDVPLSQRDARAIDARAAWDVAGAFDVLEHVDDDPPLLAALHAAVRPGGGILVTVPQHRWLWGPADEYACHVRRYSRAELVEKVTQAGFRVQRVTSWVFLLLPALAASRWLERRRASTFDPLTEHARAARLRPLLEGVMDAELALVRRGVSLPAGGSLLLVARRD